MGKGQVGGVVWGAAGRAVWRHATSQKRGGVAGGTPLKGSGVSPRLRPPEAAALPPALMAPAATAPPGPLVSRPSGGHPHHRPHRALHPHPLPRELPGWVGGWVPDAGPAPCCLRAAGGWAGGEGWARAGRQAGRVPPPPGRHVAALPEGLLSHQPAVLIRTTQSLLPAGFPDIVEVGQMLEVRAEASTQRGCLPGGAMRCHRRQRSAGRPPAPPAGPRAPAATGGQHSLLSFSAPAAPDSPRPAMQAATPPAAALHPLPCHATSPLRRSPATWPPAPRAARSTCRRAALQRAAVRAAAAPARAAPPRKGGRPGPPPAESRVGLGSGAPACGEPSRCPGIISASLAPRLRPSLLHRSPTRARPRSRASPAPAPGWTACSTS